MATTGRVKIFDYEKGFGFIVTDDRKDDIFVHITNVIGPEQIGHGDRVEFTIEPSTRKPGSFTAKNVRLV